MIRHKLPKKFLVKHTGLVPTSAYEMKHNLKEERQLEKDVQTLNLVAIVILFIGFSFI